MKVLIIITHDEGEFVCEAKKDIVDTFLANYRKKNEGRLKALGHTQIIPEIREEEMSQEEYDSVPATSTSSMYFNGIGLEVA